MPIGDGEGPKPSARDEADAARALRYTAASSTVIFRPPPLPSVASVIPSCPNAPELPSSSSLP
jgi:hypothetical protein